jgi:NAD(P)-dependent dehydrogenase (short-subunit alcohol dehydrogenase family)
MKNILIIGGGGGLGTAIVQELLGRNYRVLVAGRTKPADRRVQSFYPIDATAQNWQSLFCKIEEETAGPIEAIIFVAGSAAFGRTSLIPQERARQTFELNFWACSEAARIAAEHWVVRRLPGKFLAILSIAALRAVPFEAYYSASRAATARFLECLQLEYANQKLEFFGIFPGLLRTLFRRNAGWYGLQPAFADEGADVVKTARAVVRLLDGRRRARVIGWRERCIELADRFLPGLYDVVVLQKRVQRLLKNL